MSWWPAPTWSKPLSGKDYEWTITTGGMDMTDELEPQDDDIVVDDPEDDEPVTDDDAEPEEGAAG